MSIFKAIKNFFVSGAPAWGKEEVEKKVEYQLKDLKKKTKKELETIGRKVGVELDRRLTKDKLISAIRKTTKK
jgi:hypothetical protein